MGQTAHLGDRVVPKVIAGKNVSVLGDPDASDAEATFGLSATPLDIQIKETIASYQ